MARSAPLAFGIGASEVSHVLATQSIWQRKPPDHAYHGHRREARSASWPRTSYWRSSPRIGAGGRPWPRRRVCRPHLRRHVGGGTPDGVQHVDRGPAPACGMISARRDDLRLRQGPSLRAGRARPGKRRWPIGRPLPSDPGATFDKEVCRSRPDEHRPHGHLGHEP